MTKSVRLLYWTWVKFLSYKVLPVNTCLKDCPLEYQHRNTRSITHKGGWRSREMLTQHSLTIHLLLLCSKPCSASAFVSINSPLWLICRVSSEPFYIFPLGRKSTIYLFIFHGELSLLHFYVMHTVLCLKISVTLQIFSDFCFVFFLVRDHSYILPYHFPLPLLLPQCPTSILPGSRLEPLGWVISRLGGKQKEFSLRWGEMLYCWEGVKQCVEWCGMGVSMEFPSPGLPTFMCDTQDQDRSWWRGVITIDSESSSGTVFWEIQSRLKWTTRKTSGFCWMQDRLPFGWATPETGIWYLLATCRLVVAAVSCITPWSPDVQIKSSRSEWWLVCPESGAAGEKAAGRLVMSGWILFWYEVVLRVGNTAGTRNWKAFLVL